MGLLSGVLFRAGAYKTPAVGNFKVGTPLPPPLKRSFWPRKGEGGGGFNFSLDSGKGMYWDLSLPHSLPTFPLLITGVAIGAPSCRECLALRAQKSRKKSPKKGLPGPVGHLDCPKSTEKVTKNSKTVFSWAPFFGERIRGNTIRGNRPERGFQRFLEFFIGFQRF